MRADEHDEIRQSRSDIEFGVFERVTQHHEHDGEGLGIVNAQLSACVYFLFVEEHIAINLGRDVPWRVSTIPYYYFIYFVTRL